jgi:Flp pilus assembly protein TadD
VNIPEFVNIAQGGLEKIDPQATEFYRLFDVAFKQMEDNRIPEAIQTFRQAIERDPDDALAHYVLATALSGNDREAEAVEEYRKATDLDPANATFLDHLAVSLAINGHPDDAVGPLQKAITLAPGAAEFRFNLGIVMESRGDFAGAVEAFQKAAELSNGKNWRAFAELAKALARTGRSAEAIKDLQKALDLAVAEHDGENAEKLRGILEHYQRDGAKATPQ